MKPNCTVRRTTASPSDAAHRWDQAYLDLLSWAAQEESSRGRRMMRAALYARVSTPRQARAQKIDEQLETLEAYVEQKGCTLRSESTSTSTRGTAARVSIALVSTTCAPRAAMAEFEMLLVTAPDRLARKYVHQVLLIEELQARSCRVEFMERPMSQDPNDQLLLQIRGAVAEYKRTLITERMRRGRLVKRLVGVEKAITQTERYNRRLCWTPTLAG